MLTLCEFPLHFFLTAWFSLSPHGRLQEKRSLYQKGQRSIVHKIA